MIGLPSRTTRKLGLASFTAATIGLVGCAGMISTQEEVQMGAEYAAQINRQLPIVEDAAVNRYINELGRRIATRADDRDIQYRFFVVNSDQINAFAVPGGFIYMNRGLIDRAENKSEFAGVLGHEIAHITQRHGIEQMARMQRAELGLNVASILLGSPGPVGQVAVQAGAGAWFASHSREAEREADYLGIRYVTDAGINPEGIVTFLQKLMEEQQRDPSRVAQWFATHPTTQSRIDATRQDVQQIPASTRQRLTTNTSAYNQFRSRVRALPAAPRQ